jgi:hypothetical protein
MRPLVARHRSALLELAIQDALAAVGTVQQGSSKTPRRIERVVGEAKPAGDGLLVRLWNGWDHPLTATLNDIRAADVTKDATIHLVIPEHRSQDLRNAIVAREAATATIQGQGVPSTDAGKEAKMAMESSRARAEDAAKAILREAVEKAQVLVAGGAEVGIGLSRADAVREAATRVLDCPRASRARPRLLGGRSSISGYAPAPDRNAPLSPLTACGASR